MDKAGFLDRIGRGNGCAHIDLALDRARELLGLPAAESHDQGLETAKKEISSELTSAQGISNPSKSDAARLSGRTGTTHE